MYFNKRAKASHPSGISDNQTFHPGGVLYFLGLLSHTYHVVTSHFLSPQGLQPEKKICLVCVGDFESDVFRSPGGSPRIAEAQPSAIPEPRGSRRRRRAWRARPCVSAKWFGPSLGTGCWEGGLRLPSLSAAAPAAPCPQPPPPRCPDPQTTPCAVCASTPGSASSSCRAGTCAAASMAPRSCVPRNWG